MVEEVIELRKQLVLEYLDQILGCGKDVDGFIQFYTIKDEGKMICAMHIFVPKNNYDRYYRLDIPSRNSVQFYNALVSISLKKYPFSYQIFDKEDLLEIQISNQLTNNSVKLAFFTEKQQEIRWKNSILKVVNNIK